MMVINFPSVQLQNQAVGSPLGVVQTWVNEPCILAGPSTATAAVAIFAAQETLVKVA